jgi:cell division protein FtsL
MKKSSKPIIITITSTLVLITIILLFAQGIRFKYEALQRKSAELESQIKTEEIKLSKLTANHQMLTSEEVIVKYASEVLGLIEANSENDQIITLDSEDIVELSESLNKLNE